MKQAILLCITLFLTSCASLSATLPAGQDLGEEKGKMPSGPNGGWSAVYSPDGGTIAFLSSTLHTPTDIWVMNTDGSGVRRLTSLGVNSFKWAADGKKILFTTRRRGFEELFSVTVDGKEEKLSGLPYRSSIPLYSPDGLLFAITAPGEGEDKNVRNLWIGTVDGERIEPVTEKISVRSMFWGLDSRKIYYEVGGKGYGVGIWEMDLATMESKAVLESGHQSGTYIGSPQYSERAGLMAYSSATPAGEFEVHTMKPDGSDIKIYKSPRLPGTSLIWAFEGKGVYYLGKDIREKEPKEPAAEKSPEKEEKSYTQHKSKKKDFERVGVTALWHLDFETGEETRISPENLHLTEAVLSPDGKKALLSGLVEKSYAPEVFSLDLSSGEMAQLLMSRVSSWLPVPFFDSSKTAFFTNEGAVDTLKIIDNKGQELVSYPGFLQELDTRLFWLPKSDGLLFVSRKVFYGLTEKEEIKFKKTSDFRSYLSADVSIQADRIILSAVPKYGETPGLYLLEVEDNRFVVKDLRFPKAQEDYPDIYLQPKWSFDGSRIAFTDGVDIWTIKADNTGRARITRHLEANEKEKGRLPLASDPVWSANGEMICYTLTVYQGEASTRQIWVMMADGSGPKMLYSEDVQSKFQVFIPEYTSQPFFDATGEHVVLTAVQNGLPNLISVNIKNGKMRKLTDTGAIFPALLPDEGVIYYTSLEGNNERLWVMNADGSGKHALTVIKAAASDHTKTPSPEHSGTGTEEGKAPENKEHGTEKNIQ